MEDLKKLKVKNWKEAAKENLERFGSEDENAQRVVVPNGDDESQIVALDSKYFEQGTTIRLPGSRGLANFRRDGHRDIQKPPTDLTAHANEL
jgi:hypothetical protein